MERLHRRQHQAGHRNRQFTLFAPEPSTRPAPTPDWQALPEETRRKLTDLMARLFVGHAGGGAAKIVIHREGADEL